MFGFNNATVEAKNILADFPSSNVVRASSLQFRCQEGWERNKILIGVNRKEKV